MEMVEEAFLHSSFSFWSTGCAWCSLLDVVMKKTWPFPADNAGCSWFIWMIRRAYLSDELIMLGFRNLGQITIHDPLWWESDFGTCFAMSSQSSHWEGRHWCLYINHVLAYITVQETSSVAGQSKNGNMTVVLIFTQLMRQLSTNLLHFPNLLQMPNGRWLALWPLSLGHCQPLMHHGALHLQGLLSVNHLHPAPLYILSAPGSEELLMFPAVLLLYNPFSTQIRKLLTSALCLMSVL